MRYGQTNEYKREWLRKRRLKYVSGKTCAFCGEADVSLLQFHHIDPETKSHNVHWGMKASRIEAEMEKCVVLCSPCHREYHAPEHGTESRYVSRGCRCPLCTEAHSESKRQYYRENREKIAERKRENLAGMECGSRTKYVYGCRCEKCLAANRAYFRSRRVSRNATD